MSGKHHKSLPMLLVVLSVLSLLTACRRRHQVQNNAPVSADDHTVSTHRLGPDIPLRLSKTEWSQFQAGPCGGADYLSFELTVSASGAVDDARLEPYRSFCDGTPAPSAPGPTVAAHLAEANAIVRGQRYIPWVVDGQPVPVVVHTSLVIAPPERLGPPRSFPVRVDPATISIGLERRGCEGRCPAYSVHLAADGTVTYKGFNYVAIPGQHQAHVPAATVTHLYDLFRQANFLSGLPLYSGAYDGGYNVLTLSMNGKSYQVADESGLSVGLPTAIRALEQAVDEGTRSADWVVGKPNIIASLDAEHWDFAAASEDNLRLFDRAIWAGNDALIARFLQLGAPVLANPSPGQPSWANTDPPPLLVASGVGNLGLVNRMLQTIKQPLAPATLFHCMLAGFSSGSLLMVNFWLDRGANPHLRPVTLDGKLIPPNDAVDPLRRAILSGKPEMVRRALELGFQPNKRISGSESPLLYAFQSVRPADFNPDVIRVLLDAGANPNARGLIGETALHEAPTAEVLRMLLTANANPNLADELGYTPLIKHAANSEAIRVLLMAGADPTLRDKQGGTVLDAAGEYGGCASCQEQLSAALHARGVDPATFHKTTVHSKT